MNKLFRGEMFDICSWCSAAVLQWSRTGGGMRGGTMMDAQLSPPHAAQSGPWTPAALQHCSTAALHHAPHCSGHRGGGAANRPLNSLLRLSSPHLTPSNYLYVVRC